MPCYHPIKGFISYNGDKRKFVPTKIIPPFESKMEVPCGQCIGCKLDYSRNWAVRIEKEKNEYTSNLFITLTYDQDNLPQHGTLIKREYKNFDKRLRDHFAIKKLNPDTGRMKKHYQLIRYFACGEYGEKTYRPHYHAILFNVKFDDMILWKKTKSGELLYQSKTLTKIWGKGHTAIGNVTFESAAYVARYVMKKITGDKADEHYKKITEIDNETGEVISSIQLLPEFTVMSRKPGIGNAHYQKYYSDMFPSDQISIYRNGKTIHSNPPRFYMDKLKKTDPKLHKKIKETRIANSQIQIDKGETTPKRLRTKEKVKLAKTINLNRQFAEFH